MSFQLTIAEGKEAGKEFVFDQGSVVIGRTADCDVILYDPGVSRKHARIFSQGKAYYVEDMGSSNGTKVNGSVVKKKQLSDGDAVALGPVVFNFSSKVIEDMDTDPRSRAGSNGAASVAKADTRISPRDKVSQSKRQKGRGVALLPENATPEAALALSNSKTASMQAVKSKRAGLARPEVRELARREDEGEEDALARPERPGKLARRDGRAQLSASDRARIRRESKGVGGSFKIFWMEASRATRGVIYTFSTVAGIAVLGGLYYLAIKEPGRELPTYPEPAQLEGYPIEDSFGEGEGVLWHRTDMKVFTFEFTAPTRAVVLLHFQAKDISQGEVAITVNGADVGLAPPDSLNVLERTNEIIVPATVLKKGEPNQVIFDNTHNPPDKDPWRIWNAWVEISLLPELPVEQLKREAQTSFDRGVLQFSRKDVGAANRYEAWKEFRNAWLNLEAHPEPRPELYRLAREKMKETQEELDSTCSKLMLEVEQSINQKDWNKARATLDYVKEYFPGKDQPCPFRADAKKEQLHL
ncbi:MAG TPA: FHA domain-containing protein [Myxococcaceae bacterium]|jgi:pSer/pThr/pTyr-binding forkhead associated (FHA) protein